MIKQVAEVMAGQGIGEWGVCRLADVQPLLPVRSRSRIPAEAKAIITILFGYYTDEYKDRNISRYAIVDDYHIVIHQILDAIVENLLKRFKTHAFIPFVDASPIPEVQAARLSGLGDVGMNGQLLSPVYGSYCFIGEIVTTMDLPVAEARPKLCTRCGACVAACPSGALTAEGFEKSRCRSHITQKKGALTGWERAQIRQGGFVWGCDCCTDACPVNRMAAPTRIKAFYRDIAPVVGQDNAGKLCGTKAYGWRGENVLLRNLRIISGENML